jgi:hypothetical protein
MKPKGEMSSTSSSTIRPVRERHRAYSGSVPSEGPIADIYKGSFQFAVRTLSKLRNIANPKLKGEEIGLRRRPVALLYRLSHINEASIVWDQSGPEIPRQALWEQWR